MQNIIRTYRYKMFTIKKDGHLEYTGDFDLDIYDFVSFLSLLLENKSSLEEVLNFSTKEKDFTFSYEELDSFLTLDIKYIPEKALCARVSIEKSLANSQDILHYLKQLFIKSVQDHLAYKIEPSLQQTFHAFPVLLGTKEIHVIKKQKFPSYTPKLVDVVKKHKRSAKILINKINYGNFWRARAKSEILTEGDVRLDLQGVDQEKFNYQIQTGRDTIAAILIDICISKITIPSEQVYAIRKIKSGFQKSLDDLHIYKISFNNN